METEGPPRSQPGSAFREFVETILFTLLIYLLVRTFLFENYRVVGSSMEPTLTNDQFLVVNKLGYRLYQPHRGDIIVFYDPNEDSRKLIKRVIGLPGEEVELKDGRVWINNQPIDEPYLADAGRSNRPASLVPEGQFFVLGDNRNNSSDSRSWGLLSRDKIVGKAWLSYWPPSQWGAIRHEAYGDVP